MNNNSKREINFSSRWRVTRYPKATSRTLKICQFHSTSFLSFFQSLNKFLDCGASISRPVRFDLCPTKCDRTYIDEQCEFLHRMDVDAIFKQINLRYE